VFRLAKVSDFLRELSESAGLKFGLAWLAFCVLVVPTALLMTLGVPDRYALPTMLAAILPFLYFVFCISRWLRSPETHRPLRSDDLALSRDIQLVLLDFLHRNGVGRIAESDMHRLVFEVDRFLPVPMNFVQRPIRYSHDLFQCLKALEREGLVDELIYVHDGWAPRHLYELTRVGRMQAVEILERMRAFKELPLDRIFGSAATAASQLRLLPSTGD